MWLAVVSSGLSFLLAFSFSTCSSSESMGWPDGGFGLLFGSVYAISGPGMH